MTIVCVETSVWARLSDREDKDKRRMTFTFLRWAKKRCDLRISRIVRSELAKTSDESVRKRTERKIRAIRPRTITSGSAVERIVQALVQRNVLTSTHLADLYHVAYALVDRADCLVTWDQADLAREWTRDRVNRYCEDTGRKALFIGTPMEVMRWLGTRIP